MRGDTVSIGELARRTGCKIETIRYYERMGLAPPPLRTEGGQRRYGEAAIKRLSFIRRSRDLGFSIEQIRELIALSEEAPVDCDQVREVAERHLDNVQAKIADLRRMEATLTDSVEQCLQNRSVACPIIDSLSEP